MAGEQKEKWERDAHQNWVEERRQHKDETAIPPNRTSREKVVGLCIVAVLVVLLIFSAISVPGHVN
jgi:hypothetical protein